MPRRSVSSALASANLWQFLHRHTPGPEILGAETHRAKRKREACPVTRDVSMRQRRFVILLILVPESKWVEGTRESFARFRTPNLPEIESTHHPTNQQPHSLSLSQEAHTCFHPLLPPSRCCSEPAQTSSRVPPPSPTWRHPHHQLEAAQDLR